MKTFLYSLLLLTTLSSSNQTSLHLRNTLQSLNIDLLRDRTSLILNVGLGTPSQYFRTMLDINSNHLYLGNITLSKSLPRTFVPSQSSSFESTSTSVQTSSQSGEEVLDFISLGDSSIISKDKKFNFVLLNKLDTYTRHEAVLGLSREYPGKLKYGKGTTIEANPRFSLLQYLYTTQTISHRQFSIKFHNNDNAVLTIGQSKENINNMPSCKPNQRIKNTYTYHKWNCPYRGIYMEDGTALYEFNVDEEQSVVFETIFDYIQLPRKIGKGVLNKINEVFGETCRLFTDSNKGSGLECEGDVDISKTPTLIVKLSSGFEFKLMGKELFESAIMSGKEGKFGYVCKIFGSKFNKDSIRIGYSFMKYYQMYFDMDEGSISFGAFKDVFERTVADNAKGYVYKRKEEGTFWKGLSYVLLIILIVVVGGLLYRKRGMKKRLALRSIMKEKKGGTDSNEKFITPIGKPMVDK